MTHELAAAKFRHSNQRASVPASNVVGPAAVSADRGAITVAVPFAGYKVRLFHSTLESLAEPSRFILRALSREGITVADLLAVTGLEPTQVERLLLRLQQFQLLGDDETLTDYGRKLGRALDRGLHGAEAMLWLDRLRARTTLLLLNDAPLQTAEALAPGIPRLTAIDGRSEVFRQEQRLFSWLQHRNRQLPLQHLIETLWGDEVINLPDGPQAASQAWQLQLPLEQTPTASLFLPVSLPMPASDESSWLRQAHTDNHQRLILPALDWRIGYQTPVGLNLTDAVPSEQQILHCLVSDLPLNVADVEEAPLDEDIGWSLLPVLEQLQSRIHSAPPYLERAVSIQCRGRAMSVDNQSVLMAASHEYVNHTYPSIAA